MGSQAPGRRRLLLTGLGAGCLGLLLGCAPILPGAPPAARVRRIGILTAGTVESFVPYGEELRQGLRELGWVEGRDISIDLRTANGRAERLRGLATELVGLQAEVIVTGGHEAIRAAMQATTTVPIVFATAGDPVGEGLIASLARPGGNVTGLRHRAGEEEYAKRLQILREIVPHLSRVAVLAFRLAAREVQDTVALVRAQGLDVVSLEVPSPDALDAALGAATTAGADGLFVSTDAVFTPLAPRIVAFAERHRLPAIYATDNYVREGGLLSYGARISENWHRVATTIDKVLKGARPADLPVEQPTRFDLIVNLRAAQAIGLSIPPSVLVQATEVLQ